MNTDQPLPTNHREESSDNLPLGEIFPLTPDDAAAEIKASLDRISITLLEEIDHLRTIQTRTHPLQQIMTGIYIELQIRTLKAFRIGINNIHQQRRGPRRPYRI